MPFGALSAGQRMVVKLELLAGAKFNTAMAASTAAVGKFGIAVKNAAVSAVTLTRTNAAVAVSTATVATQAGLLTRANGLLGRSWARLTQAHKNQTAAQKRTSAAGLAYNQILFTLRRATFYATLAIVGLTAAVLRMGFQYNEAMDSARASLEKVIKPQQRLNAELRELFLLAAVTPFTFEDTTKAFRRMYFALHPVGVSIKTINGLLTGMTDILSAAGNVTPAALNRVSVALQKMGVQGYLSGRVMNSLISSGIPINAALQKELHLTADQLGDVAALRLPANSVMKALIDYSKTAAFRGQALAQANKTIFGAWSSFKDMLSMSVGAKEAGPMEGMRKVLFNVNKELFPLLRADKPVSITRIAEAFDKQLTPNSHALIQTFTLLQYTLKSLLTIFGGLFWVLSGVSWIINKLTFNLFGARTGVKGLGWVLGVAITAFLLFKSVMFAVGLADDILMLKNKALVKWIRFIGWYLYKIAIPAMWRWVAALWAQNAALLANPWTWVIIALVAIIVTLVILYKKWGWFHDLVVRSWKWIRTHDKEIALALTIAFGPIGVAAAAMLLLITRWEKFKKLTGKIVHPFGTPTQREQQRPGSFSWRDIGRGNDPVDRWLQKHVFSVGRKKVHLNTSIMDILGFQHGGRVPFSGMHLVGEAGPELVHMPGGATVIPITQRTINPIGSQFADDGGSRPPEIIQLVVDRKVLAEVVAHARQDKLARK